MIGDRIGHLRDLTTATAVRQRTKATFARSQYVRKVVMMNVPLSEQRVAARFHREPIVNCGFGRPKNANVVRFPPCRLFPVVCKISHRRLICGARMRTITTIRGWFYGPNDDSGGNAGHFWTAGILHQRSGYRNRRAERPHGLRRQTRRRHSLALFVRDASRQAYGQRSNRDDRRRRGLQPRSDAGPPYRSLRFTEKVGPKLVAGNSCFLLDLINSRQRDGFLRPPCHGRLVDIRLASEVGKAEALGVEKFCQGDLHGVIVAQLATLVKRNVAQIINDTETETRHSRNHV
jgi:hypothetical protein